MRRLSALLSVLSVLIAATATGATPAPDPAVLTANLMRTGGDPYREGYFGSGDARVHYVEAGSGPLILLYHGFPSFWFCWFHQMEALKARYHVVALDAPGAGLSAKPQSRGAAPPQAYRIANLARGLDALARNVGGDRPFILIGHDWGAALAFAYAQAYPKRLRAVIAMSAPPYNLFLDLVAHDVDQRRRSAYMQAFESLRLADIVPRKLPERLGAGYDALVAAGSLTAAEGALFHRALADPTAIDGGMNWYRANIPAFDLIDANTYWPVDNRPVTVPTLLIWGDTDQTFVPAAIDGVQGYARDLRVVRLAGIGHWTPLDRPAQASAAITSFLSERVDPLRAALSGGRARRGHLPKLGETQRWRTE